MNCGVGGIDYNEYFNQPSELIQVSESDSNYSPDIITSDPITIMTRISGGDRFYREDNQWAISEKTYKTLYPVNVKDIINGQTVVFVKPIYEFDGSLAYYKAYV